MAIHSALNLNPSDGRLAVVVDIFLPQIFSKRKTSFMAESETMSVDTSIDVQDDPLQDIPNEEVFKLLEETLRSNEVLRAENQMFEKYLKRVEPQISVTSGHLTSVTTTQVEISARVGRKRSKSRSSASERSLKLTAEQKCDIAQREIEELREEIERLRDESERILDNYKAVMEEADVRVVEIRKSSYEFERDIVKGSINPRTGNIMAEKLVRYFEDRLRGREALIEKLRLKNSTLKVQRQKLHMQLKQKEEMGEVLHEVDFQQLKIENSQYLEKIDEKNQELLRLKLMAGNTLQVAISFVFFLL